MSAPPTRLRPWLQHVRGFADEIVLSVDARSPDGTLDVAHALADDVAVVELDGIANPAYGWTAERARGDWVLALDDDEVVAPDLIDRLPAMLREPVTHYHLPVRWVVCAADGSLAWIRQFPWFPNHATRLFRNLRGGFHHPPRQHGVWEVVGEGRALDAGCDAIYHLHLLLFDRAQREAKMRDHYRPRAHGGAPSCEEYYLYEDYRSSIELVPLKDERFVEWLASVRVGEPAPADDPQAKPDVARAQRLTLAELHERAADRAPYPPIWSAEYLSHDTPDVLLANRGCAATVRVRNTSRGTWRSCGDVQGRVVVSYRWRTPAGEVVVPQGDVTVLPQAVTPGGEFEVIAGLWTPHEPGRYVLEWDMLCEREAWFSERGVAPLVHHVEVRDRGRRPAAPHFSSAPPPAPAPVRAAGAEPKRAARPSLLRKLSRQLTRT